MKAFYLLNQYWLNKIFIYIMVRGLSIYCENGIIVEEIINRERINE